MGAARGRPLLLPERPGWGPGPQGIRRAWGDCGGYSPRGRSAKAKPREARAEREREDLEGARGLATAADELHEAAETLARAELVAAGYHRHKGEWRLGRDA